MVVRSSRRCVRSLGNLLVYLAML
uniref:Uncharacterized protein n=1 Tax=Arundo donax TaxID=35708 RepID=A0A0A9DA59_ARUDO